MLVGKRIKDMRLEKGMSQQELGDLIGVTKVSICGYENGTRTPSLETFCILAEIFETTTDYLLGREVSVVNEEGNESALTKNITRICRGCHDGSFSLELAYTGNEYVKQDGKTCFHTSINWFIAWNFLLVGD